MPFPYFPADIRCRSLTAIIRSLFSLLATRLPQSPVYYTQVIRAGVAVAGLWRGSSNGHPCPRWKLSRLIGLPPRGQPHLCVYPRRELPVVQSLGETKLRLSHSQAAYARPTSPSLNLPSHNTAMIRSVRRGFNPNEKKNVAGLCLTQTFSVDSTLTHVIT